MNELETNPGPIEDELRWDIDRYLLHDPEMDRDAFEQRMLEDPRIAMAVGNAVEQLMLIKAANLEVDQAVDIRVEPIREVDHRQGWLRVAAAVAALLLIAVLFGMLRSLDGPAVVQTPQETNESWNISDVAENWVVLQTEDSNPAYLVDGAGEDLEVSMVTAGTEQPPAEEEWIIEAAQQFFAAMES